ncbi:MAG: hypothetical protein NTY88_02905 [Bacteroidetes bacterium]|nr:hypothetical protein [Bacteroidota bacterium]
MKKNLLQFNIALTVALFALLAVSSCKKETTPTTTTNTTTATTAEYFLQGTFDGAPVTLEGTPEAFTTSLDYVEHEAEHHGHDADGDGDDDDDDDNENTPLVTGTRWTTTDGANAVRTHGSIEVRKVVIRVFIAPMPTNQLHFDMLTPRTFSFFDGVTNTDGAYITFRDGSGVLWTSTGDQTGSTITINSRGELVGTSTKFAGTFTAKMYDGNGNAKVLSNVSFAGLAGL